MSFIPDIAVLFAYAMAVLVVALTPGPDMTFFVSRAISQGPLSGIAAVTGAHFGILVHTSLVAFGLSALIVASPVLFTMVKIAGAFYLGFLAYQAIRHGSAFTMSEVSPTSRSLLQDFIKGIWINLLNPKIILFFMTFLPQFISVGEENATGKLFFLGVMFVAISTPITFSIILAASGFANWMKQNAKATRVIDYLFAGIFGAFAIRILFTERG